jgi:hypothetical protein
MRNFSDELFFTKEIIVINSMETDKATDKVKYVENQIELAFFPEGGSLIDNVSSNVAFKAVNSLGKGCDVTGKIFSSNGDLITTFKSRHLGMGSFFLRPTAGLKYYSVYKGADSIEFKTQLPASFPVGITFSLSMNQDDELLITTKTNSQTLPIVSENGLLLSFSVRKEVFKTIPYKINSPVTSFVVPGEELPDGIIMLTLSATNNLPLSERLFYIQNETPPKIQIETDKTVYSKRDPVSIKISMSGDSTIENDANVSLSVVNDSLMDNTSRYPRTIASWFLLESDVRGYVEDPSYYFDQSNPERLSDMDLLLRTQGWRDFGWKYDKEYFHAENGFKISGRLKKYYLNKPIEGSRVSVGIFGTSGTYISSVPLDSTGRFKLSGMDLTGDARLVVTGIDKKDRLKGVVILDSVVYNPAKVSDSLTFASILIENNKNRYRSYYTINESIRKKYKLSDTISLGQVNILSQKPIDAQAQKIERSRMLYEKPEAGLIVTESMYSYNNLPEALNGRIAGVTVILSHTRTINGVSGMEMNYHIRVRQDPHAPDALILVDGIKTTMEDLVTIPVNFIDRIDILKSVGTTSVFGFDASGGVVNFITRVGGPGYMSVNYSTNKRISGFNSSRIFYSPTHQKDSNSDYNPDLRSTLLWKPDINLTGDEKVVINYYNGDNASFVSLKAEGVTASGIPVTGNAKYEVR